MRIKKTDLPGVMLIKPERFIDNRGFFSENWQQNKYSVLGVDDLSRQDNVSHSNSKGTLRGLHCQLIPRAQAKLVQVMSGTIFDVAVDARLGSPTYGHWVGYELSAKNGSQLYIPKGFLHGFLTLEDNTVVSYKCSDYYDAKSERSVSYNDPQIAIAWPDVGRELILSKKDLAAKNLSDTAPLFKFGDVS